MKENKGLEELWESLRPSNDAIWFDTSSNIFHHYRNLVAQAKRITFPGRKGRYYPPDMAGWSNTHKRVYRYSNPIAWLLESDHLFTLIYPLFAYIAVICWLLEGVYFFSIAFGDRFLQSSAHSLTWWDYLVSVLIVVIAIGMIPAAYIRWREFSVDKRYSRWLRILLSLVIVIAIFGFSFWGLSFKHPLTLIGVLRSASNLVSLIMAYVLFLIPFFSFGLLLLLDSLNFFYDQVITIIGDFFILHNPLPFILISELLYKPISQEKDEWRLSDLPAQELVALQKWAESNRESSGKRVTPMLVFVAIAGLFAKTKLFNSFVQNVVNFLQKWFEFLRTNGSGAILSIQGFIFGSILLSFVIFLVLFLIALFSELFRNVVVQSLIIEACIVAGYSSTRVEEGDKILRPQKCLNKPWWKKILGI